MSSDVSVVIGLGHDLASIKYYEMAVNTILFYDYLLTLPDEVEYAWRRERKSWVFGLFLMNRYFPMGYQLWMLNVAYGQNFSQPFCDKTAFFSALAFVISTFLAQTVLTLRVYAITSKNRVMTSFFCFLSVAQLTFGLYWVGFTAKFGAVQVLPIPFDAYRLCIFVRHRTYEIVFTTLSLSYDLLAFSLVVFLVLWTDLHNVTMARLFRTIARDATYYFLVIFSSHLVFELTLLFARPTLQPLPSLGNVVYLPVMIARLMISLKKATTSREEVWRLGVAESVILPSSAAFAARRTGATTGDEIQLDTLAGVCERAQGWTVTAV